MTSGQEQLAGRAVDVHEVDTGFAADINEDRGSGLRGPVTERGAAARPTRSRCVEPESDPASKHDQKASPHGPEAKPAGDRVRGVARSRSGLIDGPVPIQKSNVALILNQRAARIDVGRSQVTKLLFTPSAAFELNTW